RSCCVWSGAALILVSSIVLSASSRPIAHSRLGVRFLERDIGIILCQSARSGHTHHGVFFKLSPELLTFCLFRQTDIRLNKVVFTEVKKLFKDLCQLNA